MSKKTDVCVSFTVIDQTENEEVLSKKSEKRTFWCWVTKDKIKMRNFPITLKLKLDILKSAV